MRKLYFAGAALVASLAVGVAGVSATDTDTNGVVTQSLTAKYKPTKLPNKGKGKGTRLGTNVRVVNAQNPGQVPDPAELVVIHYDDASKFNTKKFPRCKKSLEGTTTKQAKKLCKKAKVGQGFATVLLPSGTGPATELPATVTAFNGAKAQASNGAKGPSLILHSEVLFPKAEDDPATPEDESQQPRQTLTTILTGVLAGSTIGNDFGKSLNVDVPPIAGGAGSIEEFEANIKAKIKKGKGKKKKKIDYIQTVCNEKTLDQLGVFDYQSSPQIVVEDSVKCKPKKVKKNKGRKGKKKGKKGKK